MSRITKLISRLQTTASESQNVEYDESARATLLQLSRELTASLQAPDEVCSLLAFSGGAFMCVRLADELKVFDLLCESSPRTTSDLSSSTGAEFGLIVRLLRTLAGMGFVAQLDVDLYGPTAVTRQMTMSSVRAGVKFFHEESVPSVRMAPEYFRLNGWRLPTSMVDGPYQFAEGTEDDPFTHMSKKPGRNLQDQPTCTGCVPTDAVPQE
ncbi:uncharacterized protein LTR77_005876 [Saxophila tyrrhenica]|uniref:O-methyltransferase dimerisation domain-containing protein n=1 Tax=Saxophila tyrrhenica TaxID=1690608 RepID=A0AAV9P9T9_9PEZI|nr:hypothetical protein LTR77_005876 [Saxophila tyrrhenica]